MILKNTDLLRAGKDSNVFFSIERQERCLQPSPDAIKESA